MLEIERCCCAGFTIPVFVSNEFYCTRFFCVFNQVRCLERCSKKRSDGVLIRILAHARYVPFFSNLENLKFKLVNIYYELILNSIIRC